MIGLVILGAIVGIGGVVLFSGKGEGFQFLMAAKSLFIQDLSKTPKGAEIVYSKAIEEDRTRYQLAADTYASLSGQLMQTKAKHDQAEDGVSKIEEQMEKLAKCGDTDGLRVFSQERANLLVEVASYRKQGEKLAPLVAEAKNICEECENILKKRERDKSIKVNEYRLTDSMKKTYAALDQLRADTTTGKLLKAVDEGLDKNKQIAVGAGVVHASKTGTQIARLDKKISENDADDYVQELLAKHKN